MVKVFEITMNNGVDPRTGKKIGLETGDPCQFASFDELCEAYPEQLRHFVEIKVKGNNVIERLYATYMPTPFLSLLIDDCIKEGKDYHDGGARYNTSYIQGVGLGTITDAMTGIKFNVFDQKKLTMKELMLALADNFTGYEKVQQILLNKTPKYGNDDDYVDDIMKWLFETYYRAVDGRKNTRQGSYGCNQICS